MPRSEKDIPSAPTIPNRRLFPSSGAVEGKDGEKHSLLSGEMATYIYHLLGIAKILSANIAHWLSRRPPPEFPATRSC